MTDITERLRSIYVAEGANYVGEAADLIDKLRAESDRARHYRAAEFADITAERDGWKSLAEQRDRQIKGLVNDVHSCGPTCQKAGCVNRRLREALQDVFIGIGMGGSAYEISQRTTPIIRAALGETK